MGDFNNHQGIVRISLQLGKDPGGDERMGHGLQLTECLRVGKDNRCQPVSGYPTLHHYLWPATTDRAIGLPLRLEHRMTDLICMNNRYSAAREDESDLALAGPDSPRQKQAPLPKVVHEVTVT